MNFYPIVPIDYLYSLASLSNHQMVLAHWLSEPRYLEFYKNRKDDFILLDNGCCELGKSMSVGELISAYCELGHVDLLVLPDTKVVEDNLKLFSSSLSVIRQNISISTALMAVPQTFEDLDYMSQSDIDYIGLTRDWGVPGYDRAELIDKYEDCGKKFHLLGFYRNPIGEVESVRKFGNLVTGVDSSLPYRLMSRFKRIKEYAPYPELINMYDGLDKNLLSFMKEELKWYLDWITEGSQSNLVPV